jgi:hypothetical protein
MAPDQFYRRTPRRVASWSRSLRVVELAVAGWSQARIARSMGISRQSVHRRLWLMVRRAAERDRDRREGRRPTPWWHPFQGPEEPRSRKRHAPTPR